MPQDARPPPREDHGGSRELVESILAPRVWAQLVLELRLSVRQSQAARDLLLGEKELATAQRLGISVHTLHNHRRRLYLKLDAHDAAGAVTRLLAAGVAIQSNATGALKENRDGGRESVDRRD